MTQRFDSPVSVKVATESLSCGEFQRALHMAELAVQNTPGDCAWMMIQAIALSELGRTSEALPLFKRLTKLQPRDAQHWCNLGNALCELNQEKEALPNLIQAMILGANNSALNFALARAYVQLGPTELARRHILKAIEQAPNEAEFQLLYVRIMAVMDNVEEADEALQRLQVLPLDDGQCNELGYLLMRSQFYTQALAIFSRPTEDADLATDREIGMALTLERINRLDEAMAIEENLSLARVQGTEKLYRVFLQLRSKMAMRRKNYAQAVADLEFLLQQELHDVALTTALYFELAAAFDKNAQTESAMHTLAKAHSMRKDSVAQDHPSLRGHTGILTILEEPVLIRETPAHIQDANPDPLFVVGFPRSGTTLLEQLLDAHPGLVSFDEQPLMQRIIQRLHSIGPSIPEAALHVSDAEIASIRTNYFASTEYLTQGLNGRRSVDKNPLNMIRLPLLQHVFPGSQAILAIRHPCDVVLSCYMQHFRAPAFAITFEQLESTAEMYNKVFSRWYAHYEKMRWPVLEWKYENLVADTEGRSRELFQFLNLPWQDDLLAFTERAKNKGAIHTPSYTQVIERVNARSVGRWQAYKKFYTPAVMQHLNPWLERFGYSADA